MLLSRLQSLIGGIYDVSVAHDVYDFLVTDRQRLPAVARGGTAEEELIVAQPVEGDDEVALIFGGNKSLGHFPENEVSETKSSGKQD